MNRSKLLMVVLAMMIVLPCFAKKKVKLEGTWQRLHRTPFEEIPVEVWVKDDNKELLLEFSKILGTVQITVRNSAGQLVYTQSVETDTTSSLIVKLEEMQRIGMVVLISDGENVISGEF